MTHSRRNTTRVSRLVVTFSTRTQRTWIDNENSTIL